MQDMFDRALQFVLSWEGGYTVDHAGPTKFGVTQATYDRYRKDRGLYQRPVRYATKAEARDIYEWYYWLPAKCHELPTPLDIVMFDASVQHGIPRARRLYAMTRAANRPDAQPLEAALEFIEVRKRFYRQIAERNPAMQQYLRGWLNRMDALARLADEVARGECST